MVLLEGFAIGKGIALTTGLVKTASAGSVGATAALMAPSPGVMDSVPLAGLGHALSSLASSAVTALTEAEKAGLGIFTSSAAFCSFVAYYGLLSPEQGSESSEERDEADNRTTTKMLAVSIPACALTDSIMAGIIVQSIGQAIAVPLRTWAVGGLLLSFPVSFLVRRVVKQHGIRCGFVLESAATVVAFSWLSWGTMLLCNFPEGAHIVPLLWWSSFGQCAVMWSVTTVSASTMIITTVLSLLPQTLDQ
mmetsp:Transcript_37609/g.117187  ORF Transcript_37609/g.117187 Transcript_37609/m.117187 type:complete len:249 (-) Transcript_37609:207-953(-)